MGRDKYLSSYFRSVSNSRFRGRVAGGRLRGCGALARIAGLPVAAEQLRPRQRDTDRGDRQGRPVRQRRAEGIGGWRPAPWYEAVSLCGEHLGGDGAEAAGAV